MKHKIFTILIAQIFIIPMLAQVKSIPIVDK